MNDDNRELIKVLEEQRAAYLRALPRKVADLEALWERLEAGTGGRDSGVELERVAHGIAGAGAMFGLPQASLDARALEDRVHRLIDAGEAADAGSRMAVASALQDSQMQRAPRPMKLPGIDLAMALIKAIRLAPHRIVGMMAIVMVAAVWTMTLQRAAFERAQAIAEATRTTSNLTIAYEENASSTLHDVDQALEMLKRGYEEKGAHLDVDELMRGTAFEPSVFINLTILGADGVPVVSRQRFDRVSFAEREYFQFHRQHADPRLFVAKPSVGGISGKWVILMTKRIGRADGSFGGVAVASVDPAFFLDFYRRVDLGKDGLVTLVGLDGVTRARQAGDKGSFGEDMRSSTLLAEQAKKPMGTFVSVGRLEGIRRFYSYRTLVKYPLVVAVAISEAEVMAPVAERQRNYQLMAALASVLILVFAALLARAIKRQRRYIKSLAATQEKLRDSEAMSRAITENMASAVIIAEPDGTIVSANEAAETIYGYSSEELVGRGVAMLVEKSARASLPTLLEYWRTLEGNFRESAREFTCVRKDGTVFPIEVRFSRQDVNGRCLYVGISHDITERKRMERELRAREAQFRITFDQPLVGVGHVALDGHVLRANSKLCEMLGFTEAELQARSFRDVTLPEDIERSARLYQQLLEDGPRSSGRQITKRHVRKDGSLTWSLTSVSLVHDAADQPEFFLVMVQDISELKRIDLMKSEFVSTVSHELRTPLTSIRGSLGLIAGGVAGPIPDAAKSLVDIAASNCERLIRLINDILDVEKIESGQLRFDARVMELRPLMEEAIAANQAFADQHGVRIEASAPPEPILANIDPDRLNQVLTNLISNAVKFSPAGRPVEIRLGHRGERALIEIRDRGPGIPDEFRARIFGKFSQADGSDARKRGGSGLGLNISKAIVERLGGTIGFSSELGAGTTFFIEFPEWRPTAVPATATRQAPRVLVCEDDRDIAKLVGMMLDKAGYKADFAYTAGEASARLEADAYAAMTLDLKLPDRDGIALIRELRAKERTHRLPIVVVSAAVEEGRVQLNNEALTVSAWLGKPIDENRLVTAIRHAIEGTPDGKPRILHVEDDPDIQRVASAVARDFATFEFAGTLLEARALLAERRFDLVLLDLCLPDGSGWNLMKELGALHPRPPVVVFTASDTRAGDTAGVAACLVKASTTNQKLLDTLQRVLAKELPVAA